MSTNVVMPQMGESIAEGTIVRWIKKVGDAVDRDEPLFEISTDKVDAEIPSPASGRLAEILVAEGTTVAVQTVLARIEVAGESLQAPSAGGAPPASAPEPPPPPIETAAAMPVSPVLDRLASEPSPAEPAPGEPAPGEATASEESWVPSSTLRPCTAASEPNASASATP